MTLKGIEVKEPDILYKHKPFDKKEDRFPHQEVIYMGCPQVFGQKMGLYIG
jgi:hypothetical protein